MARTTFDPEPDPTRRGPPAADPRDARPTAPAAAASAGARWVSGLGTLLLVLAAATFVAVRWDRIPDEARFGALVAVTGASPAASARLQRRFPVTAAALLHLGVLLVPLDVAAVGVWRGWEWPRMLLMQGLATTAVCGIAGNHRPSMVLRGVAASGVVLLTGGIGALFGVPAGPVLAGVALAAAAGPPLARHGARAAWDRSAVAWATLAGLATPLAAARHAGFTGAGVLADLGLATRAPHPAAALTGVVAAVALLLVASRRRSVPIALVGVASLLSGAATSWRGLEPGPAASLAAGAAVLLVIEVAAWTVSRDPFWSRLATPLACAVEGVAGAVTAGLGLVVTVAAVDPPGSLPAGTAAGLIGLTWVAAAARHRRHRGATVTWPWTHRSPGPVAAMPLAAAVAGGAGVVLVSGSPVASSVGLAVVALALLGLPPTLLPGAAASRFGAVGLLTWAVLVAHPLPALAGGVALAGVTGTTAAAVDLARLRDRGSFDPAVRGLAHLTLLPLVTGGLVVARAATVPGAADAIGGLGPAAMASLGALGAAWAASAALDRIEVAPLGVIHRVVALPAAVLPAVVHGPTLGEGEVLLLAAAVALVALVEAVRLDEPLLVLGAAAATPVVIVSAVPMAAGRFAGPAEASVVVTLSAVVWCGAGGALPARWGHAVTLGGGLVAVAGLVLGAEDAESFAVDLVVVGTALLAGGAVRRATAPALVGTGLATLGLWQLLALHQVEISEPYVVPVAVLWLVASAHLRVESRETLGSPLSSWIAHAPGPALVGGAAVAERLTGGGAGHALVAGAVGLVAVVVGAAARLAGPLAAGTVLVGGVAVHETLGVTAGVPTWVWLAGGGAALLGAGLIMERRGTGPVDTGRRLVDLLGEHFT